MLSALGAVVEGALEASFQIARAHAKLSVADINQHKAIMEAILARTVWPRCAPRKRHLKHPKLCRSPRCVPRGSIE